MKYSKSAIGLLTAQYRSVLKKCWMINVGLFALMGATFATPAEAQVDPTSQTWDVMTLGKKTLTGTDVLWSGIEKIATVTLDGEKIAAALTNQTVASASHAGTADSATTATTATYASKIKVDDSEYSLNSYFAKQSEFATLQNSAS